MKQFFEECLKNLEALTGLRQLAYWEMEAAKDETSAKQKLELCVRAMVNVCKLYPEFDEERLKRIVRKMMVEDTTYESLNARALSKWLERERQQGRPVSQITEDEMTPQEQVSEEKVNDYIKQLKEIIANSTRPVPKLTPEEIAKEGQERVRSPYLDKMREEWRKNQPPLQIFSVEGLEFEAHTIEEARLLHRQHIEQNYEKPKEI